MPFYLRKSVRFGPIRFNLSKSGIGVSGGIKGARIGSGPRGNYVHMGRHGVYYRKSLGGKSRRLKNQEKPRVEQEEVHMEEIDSADVAEMRDSDSEALLQEFDEKRKKFSYAKMVGWLLLPAALFVSQSTPDSLGALVFIGVGLYIAARFADARRKTVVLLYNLEPEVEEACQKFHEAFDRLAGSNKIWHIEARGEVKDRKYNAGAAHQVTRKSIRLASGEPKAGMKTNISVPQIQVGRQVLQFLPDRLLIFAPNGVGAVSYQDLDVDSTSQRFIEEERVPKDAEVVGQTWQYVNKSGGPDRRFKDNKEIPIVLYQRIHFQSSSGLNELLQVSNRELAEVFVSAVGVLRRP